MAKFKDVVIEEFVHLTDDGERCVCAIRMLGIKRLEVWAKTKKEARKKAKAVYEALMNTGDDDEDKKPNRKSGKAHKNKGRAGQAKSAKRKGAGRNGGAVAGDGPVRGRGKPANKRPAKG